MGGMLDVTQAKSDQINNVDLHETKPLMVTIKHVLIERGKDQPVSISLEETEKFYRPCKGMRRLMVQLWGDDEKIYPGRKLSLYRDPDVKFGADTMGGIRISAASHIEKPRSIVVPVARGRVKAYPIAVLPNGPARKAEAVSRGTTLTDAHILAAARAAAANGTAAFTTWWNSDEGKDGRAVAKEIMGELQGTASKADLGQTEDHDPFGLPALGDEPDDTGDLIDAADAAEAGMIADAQAKAMAEFEAERAAEIARQTD